ncbi:hypothetical protein L6452_02970 [Arctium lappa]|uniref:Uncharacterized protein n=1 Tax=Arctium lappa TaxID=4217 RepID=A0ACB9FL29_ARCLA|nr:hypothetical protein L6452_02970 [Arctium lappa]
MGSSLRRSIQGKSLFLELYKGSSLRRSIQAKSLFLELYNGISTEAYQRLKWTKSDDRTIKTAVVGCISQKMKPQELVSTTGEFLTQRNHHGTSMYGTTGTLLMATLEVAFDMAFYRMWCLIWLVTSEYGIIVTKKHPGQIFIPRTLQWNFYGGLHAVPLIFFLGKIVSVHACTEQLDTLGLFHTTYRKLFSTSSNEDACWMTLEAGSNAHKSALLIRHLVNELILVAYAVHRYAYNALFGGLVSTPSNEDACWTILEASSSLTLLQIVCGKITNTNNATSAYSPSREFSIGRHDIPNKDIDNDKFLQKFNIASEEVEKDLRYEEASRPNLYSLNFTMEFLRHVRNKWNTLGSFHTTYPKLFSTPSKEDAC